MSETNPIQTSVATKVSAAETVIGHWVTMIKAHEKLLVCIIVAATVFHLGNKAYDAYGNYLTHKQSETNLQIAAQESTNAALQKQIDTLTVTVAAQSKIDDAKIAAAKATLANQQKIDANLPAPELAARIATLLQVKPQEVTQATLPDHLDFDSTASHAVANQLEELPALQTQLSATQDKFNGCNSVLALSTQQVTGLNNDIALEKKGRAEDAKVAAVNEKKALRKGFKLGFGTGVAVTVAVIAALKVTLHI